MRVRLPTEKHLGCLGYEGINTYLARPLGSLGSYGRYSEQYSFGGLLAINALRGIKTPTNFIHSESVCINVSIPLGA